MLSNPLVLAYERSQYRYYGQPLMFGYIMSQAAGLLHTYYSLWRYLHNKMGLPTSLTPTEAQSVMATSH